MTKRRPQIVAPKKTASESKSRAIAEPESNISQFEKVDEIKVGGIRCRISLQSNKDQPLPLYGVVKEGTGKVSCYVEAVDGEAFQITYSFDDTSMPKRGSLYLGGQYVLCDQYTFAGCSSRTIYRAALPDSGWRALTFAKPTTSGDDSNASVVKDQAKLADFGVVELKVEELISCEYTEGRNVPSSLTDKSPEAFVIHEQSKKAIGSLDVTLGALLPQPKTGRYTAVENPNTKPCTFRFACMSRLGLQLKGLVPHEGEEVAESAQRRAREQALLEEEETQLLERVERIKRRRASLDAEASGSRSNEASSSAQAMVKAEPNGMLFDYKTGGRSIQDPLIVDDSD
ncbi:hypothetical protein CF319_g6325 [Tilletia indica]|nr:hypothetical protein CF319_g6325 [Tilletia indica]